jgi:hypothetical protein
VNDTISIGLHNDTVSKVHGATHSGGPKLFINGLVLKREHSDPDFRMWIEKPLATEPSGSRPNLNNISWCWAAGHALDFAGKDPEIS